MTDNREPAFFGLSDEERIELRRLLCSDYRLSQAARERVNDLRDRATRADFDAFGHDAAAIRARLVNLKIDHGWSRTWPILAMAAGIASAIALMFLGWPR